MHSFSTNEGALFWSPTYGHGVSGKLALRAALQKLGYVNPYQSESAFFENPRDCEMWLDALRAKFEGEGTFDKKDWDSLLGHCEASNNIVYASMGLVWHVGNISTFVQATVVHFASIFAPELIEAYPEAKVILLTRDIDEWSKSVIDSLHTNALNNKDQVAENSELALVRKFLAKLLMYYYDGDLMNGKTRDAFRKHHESIRGLIPKGKLLEYNVKEGWGPLCEFLGHPVPNGEFPRLNEGKDFQVRVDQIEEELSRTMLPS